MNAIIYLTAATQDAKYNTSIILVHKSTKKATKNAIAEAEAKGYEMKSYKEFEENEYKQNLKEFNEYTMTHKCDWAYLERA